MSRRHAKAERVEMPAVVLEKARPPLVIVLGSPGEVARLVLDLGTDEVTCYQMDLYQAERLRVELAELGLRAEVATAPDLWDLPATFATALYRPPRGGERALRVDMVEQAFHILRPRGTLLAWSDYDKDQFFPAALKKVYGKVHAPASGGQTVYWAQRDGDRPRRRHEVTFHARVGEGPSLEFVSRPGVFSYGRFDDGARALVETMWVEPGDRILDVGCGCGTNGIFAALRAGPDGAVTFIDSNVRAVALAGENARRNGVPHFEAAASSAVEGPARGSIDMVLANPPYYAQGSIARLFLERSAELLRPGGRLYLVTRQPNQVGPLVEEVFRQVEAVQHRGYTVFGARTRGGRGGPESAFGPLTAGEES